MFFFVRWKSVLACLNHLSLVIL
uniref:Uncharacterized protein n=1 Tax=Rhizophora mucronata TaxID=61149 RepID=A0A2P2NTI1_RHIMU